MILKPTTLYSLLANINFVILFFALYLANTYLNIDWLTQFFALASMMILLIAVYKFIFTKTISYEISKGQIIYKFGIFVKKTEYLELFRVRDLNKTQNFIDQIIGTMKIEIISSDKSNPVFHMKGIPNAEIIDSIRKQVLISRKENRIFEI